MCFKKFFDNPGSRRSVWKFGLLGGILEAVYCKLIVLLIIGTSAWGPRNVSPLAGMTLVLLVLVFSVAISGVLVLGYPAYLVSQKKFKEAIQALGITLAILFLVAIAVILLAPFIPNPFSTTN